MTSTTATRTPMGKILRRDLYGMATTEQLLEWIYERRVRPLFLAVTGSHMWNLAKPDSDLDIRGIYLDTLNKVMALHPGDDFIEAAQQLGGNVDIQLYELGKALRMLNRHNGNIVEMLLAPTCIYIAPDIDWHNLASKFLTKRLAHYYRGYFTSQRRRAGQKRGSKALVYSYREIMAGICLMQTGRIIYDFHELYTWFQEHYWGLPNLESFMTVQTPVGDEMMRRFENDWQSLLSILDDVMLTSPLPESYEGYEELNELLLQMRLWAPPVRLKPATTLREEEL